MQRAIFAFNGTPEVCQLYFELAYNESERFKLRSHDYKYKYLRFFTAAAADAVTTKLKLSNELFYLLIIER